MVRVAIDAPVTCGGNWGGIEQFIQSLVHALGELDDGAEEYVIGVHKQNADWLNAYLGPNQRVVVNPASRWDGRKRWLGRLRKPAGWVWRLVRRTLESDVPSSHFYESLGVNVLHVPHHQFFQCLLPTIYSPHDLQHVHLPRFFSPEELRIREVTYRAGCLAACAVTTDARWTKEDVVREFGVDERKVFAIPMAPSTELFAPVTGEQETSVRQKFNLPPTFALYPAQTWEHKNHIRLLQAIAQLRVLEGVSVNLICTGKKNAFWPVIETSIRELNLDNQVRFLGFVKATELRTLYHLAQFVVHPSIFEGGGLPVLEAFHEGVPVTCSTAASLPEYAGDAALFFEPTSVDGIADALRRMVSEPELRVALAQRGTIRAREFTWERAARAYRAVYRQAAGVMLTDEERALLDRC